MKKKFVILSNPRTGSEYLVKLLEKHSSVFCMGEIFSIGPDGDEWNHSLYKKQKNPMGYLNKKYSETEKNIVGFKQISYWLSNSCFKGVEDFIKQCIEEKYVFIHLTRRNFLAQYASFMIMNEQGLGHSEKTSSKISTIELEPQLAYVNYRKWVYFDNKCHEILEKEKANYIHLEYEKDFDENKYVKDKIFKFLQVPYEEIQDPLKRTNPFSIESIVTNYDDVVGYLKKKLIGKEKDSLFAEIITK